MKCNPILQLLQQSIVPKAIQLTILDMSLHFVWHRPITQIFQREILVRITMALNHSTTTTVTHIILGFFPKQLVRRKVSYSSIDAKHIVL